MAKPMGFDGGRKRKLGALSGSCTPSSSPVPKPKRRRQAAVASICKVSVDEPTWEDKPRPIVTHGATKTYDDTWMAAYLGLDNKYELRNLAILPLVVKTALNTHECKFKPKEIGEALKKLADQDIAIADEDEDDDEDDQSVSEPVKTFQDSEDEKEPYGDRDSMDRALRIDFLARALLTVTRALESLKSDRDAIDVSEEARKKAEATVRRVSNIQYFILPTLEPQYLRAPSLGPREFKGKKEHVVEKYTRVLSLLLFAKIKLGTQSKYCQAGCIGGRLPSSENARRALSAEALNEVTARGARKWLGQKDSAYDKEKLSLTDGPVWMQAENGEDELQPVFAEKSDNAPPRRIKLEAIWLPDYPGQSRYEKKCTDAWEDEARRAELLIPSHVGGPIFAQRNTRIVVPDPRVHDDFETWRDSIRRELSFAVWKVDFVIAWHISDRVSLSDVTADLLDVKEKSQIQRTLLFSSAGREPPVSWPKFLKIVEQGGDTQTLVYICEPLFGSRLRHYPWETNAFLDDTIASTPVVVPTPDQTPRPEDENPATSTGTQARPPEDGNSTEPPPRAP